MNIVLNGFGFFRRSPRKNINSSESSIELPRSTSTREFRRKKQKRAQLPRFYSQNDGIQAAELQNTNSDDLIELVDDKGQAMMSEQSSLLGFINSGDSFDEPPTCSSYSSEFATEDSSLDKAVSECHLIRTHPLFTEGILLKCVDSQPLFSYLHYALFRCPDREKRLANISEVIRELSVRPKCQFGAYDEVFSIQKTTSATETRLPTHRHAGYIVISFKLLEDQSQQESLEKSWLSWSGAREIYKHSPRSWNLRRISLHRLPKFVNGVQRSFAYVLLCEFGSIFHPSNRLQALDMCERLRVRNCGYISLYQLQWSYSNPASTTEMLIPPNPAPRRERNPMLRGLSQEVDSSLNERPRNPKLRSRERSIGHRGLDEAENPPTFHSYHHFSDFS